MTSHCQLDECASRQKSCDDQTTTCDDQLAALEMDSGLQISDDEACVADAIATWEYHVVYHPSYRVPVLYMNGFDSGELAPAQSTTSKIKRPRLRVLHHWLCCTLICQYCQPFGCLKQLSTLASKQAD